MPIKVQCSGCGGKFHAPNEAAGKRAKCPKCTAAILVPTSGPQDVLTRTSTQPTAAAIGAPTDKARGLTSEEHTRLSRGPLADWSIVTICKSCGKGNPHNSKVCVNCRQILEPQGKPLPSIQEGKVGRRTAIYSYIRKRMEGHPVGIVILTVICGSVALVAEVGLMRLSIALEDFEVRLGLYQQGFAHQSIGTYVFLSLAILVGVGMLILTYRSNKHMSSSQRIAHTLTFTPAFTIGVIVILWGVVFVVIPAGQAVLAPFAGVAAYVSRNEVPGSPGLSRGGIPGLIGLILSIIIGAIIFCLYAGLVLAPAYQLGLLCGGKDFSALE